MVVAVFVLIDACMQFQQQAPQDKNMVDGEEQHGLAGPFDLADFDRITKRTQKLVGKTMQKNGGGSILNRSVNPIPHSLGRVNGPRSLTLNFRERYNYEKSVEIPVLSNMASI